MRSIALVAIAATILLLSLWTPSGAIAGGTEQICDVAADYPLGIEDYPEAIRRHIEVVRKHPNDALAHYHLGFAVGMVGDRIVEVSEYRRAAALGLNSWDLFLNLGLAQLEDGDLDAATDSLQEAVLLGGDHSESHFNLALVDERRGMLPDAEREALATLRLDPGQPEARNLLGVIYAQEGNTARASVTWRELVRDLPDYAPAHTNLAILGSQSMVANGETAALGLPRAAAVDAIPDRPELNLSAREMPLNPRPVEYNGR